MTKFDSWPSNPSEASSWLKCPQSGKTQVCAWSPSCSARLAVVDGGQIRSCKPVTSSFGSRQVKAKYETNWEWLASLLTLLACRCSLLEYVRSLRFLLADVPCDLLTILPKSAALTTGETLRKLRRWLIIKGFSEVSKYYWHLVACKSLHATCKSDGNLLPQGQLPIPEPSEELCIGEEFQESAARCHTRHACWPPLLSHSLASVSKSSFQLCNSSTADGQWQLLSIVSSCHCAVSLKREVEKLFKVWSKTVERSLPHRRLQCLHLYMACMPLMGTSSTILVYWD